MDLAFMFALSNETNLVKADWGKIGFIIHLAGKAHDTKNTAGEKAWFDATTFIYFSSVKAVADSVKGNI